VLAVISDMKLYTCHEYNKFEDFENNPNINGDWNIRNSWEGQNAVLDLANGKLHVVENITSNPHVRINYLLPKHLPANQTYRIKFDLEHIIGDQNWQIGVASSNTDSTYESNFTFFSGSTGHNEITFRPTGPIWRIRFLHLPVAQNMEFYLDNFSIENLSLDSNTIAMADIVSATDYYPFGAIMPGRSFQSGGYRFGFNGKEKDNETYGEGNEMDFGARIYDGRLGRWLTLDPLQTNYPDLSPYNFVNSNPIFLYDPDGKIIKPCSDKTQEHILNVLLKVFKSEDIVEQVFILNLNPTYMDKGRPIVNPNFGEITSNLNISSFRFSKKELKKMSKGLKVKFSNKELKAAYNIYKIAANEKEFGFLITSDAGRVDKGNFDISKGDVKTSSLGANPNSHPDLSAVVTGLNNAEDASRSNNSFKDEDVKKARGDFLKTETGGSDTKTYTNGDILIDASNKPDSKSTEETLQKVLTKDKTGK